MTYFISDIHGEYDLFCKLLDHIQFSDCDTMIVLGDIIDKGPQSLRLLDMIADTNNIIAIMGNHEHAFVKYVEGVFCTGHGDSDQEVLARIQQYFPQHSSRVSWELLDYIQGLPYYIEMPNYICVHAGVRLDSNGVILPMHQQNPLWMVHDRSFVDSCVIPQHSKTVLYGHTPCNYFNNTGHFVKQMRNGMSGDSIENYTKICLDTGVAFTKMLGCLRIEDMQEFYIYN